MSHKSFLRNVNMLNVSSCGSLSHSKRSKLSEIEVTDIGLFHAQTYLISIGLGVASFKAKD